MSGGTPRKPSYTRAASVLSTGSTEDVAESQPAVQVRDDAKPLLGSTRKKLSLVVLCIVYFAANASFSVISPFFPGEAASKNVDSTVVGLIFGIYPLVQFVTAPYIGLKLPTVGARFMMSSCLFLCGGSQIIFGFTSMLPKGALFIVFCFLLRIVMAVGGAGADTACFAVVAGNFGENLAMVMGALETFSGLGIMAGPPLGGVLYEYGGFKLPFIVMGCLLLSTLPVVIFVLPEQNEFNKKQGSLLKTIKIPAIAMIATNLLVGGIVLSFFDPVLAPHLNKFGLGPTKIGLVFLLIAGVYAVTAPLVGWISDKTGRTRVIMVVGVILATIGYMLLGPAPFLVFLPKRKVWLALLSMGVLGLAVSAYLVPCMPDMMETAKYKGMPDDISTHGIMSGIFNSVFSIGAFIGPLMAGVLVNYLGFEVATELLAFLLAFQGLCLALFSIYEYQKKRSKPGLMLLVNEDAESNSIEQ